MKWLIEEISSGLRQLQRKETWLVIGLLSLFGLLAYMVSNYAFRTDSMLIFLRHTAGACRQMTNGTIIAMFCGMIFFLFTALLTLGEMQRYFEFKARNAHRQARSALYRGLGWGIFAVTLSVSALVFFKNFCS